MRFFLCMWIMCFAIVWWLTFSELLEEKLEVDEKNDTRISEALNDPVKEENDCWQSKSWYRNDSQYLWGCGFWRSFEGGWCEKRSQQRTDIPVKEEDVHSHEGILNSDSEDVSNPSEDVDSEEEWMVVNEKSDGTNLCIKMS